MVKYGWKPSKAETKAPILTMRRQQMNYLGKLSTLISSYFRNYKPKWIRCQEGQVVLLKYKPHAKMKFGLNKETIDSITACLVRIPHVEEAIIYCSRAKGNYRKGSDIDLALKGEQLSPKDVLKLEHDLDELLLPYMFDISIIHQINNQDLLDHIHRVGKEFYKSPSKSNHETQN